MPLRLVLVEDHQALREGLELLLGSMLAAPELVPLLILALAVVAVIRDRRRRNSVPGLRNRRWVR